MAERMETSLAIAALDSAVTRRNSSVAGAFCIRIGAANFGQENCSRTCFVTACKVRWGTSARPVTTPPHGIILQPAADKYGTDDGW